MSANFDPNYPRDDESNILNDSEWRIHSIIIRIDAALQRSIVASGEHYVNELEKFYENPRPRNREELSIWNELTSLENRFALKDYIEKYIKPTQGLPKLYSALLDFATRSQEV